MELKVIAYIETDFPEKFGIPRQSSIVKELQGRIVFEPEYRTMDAIKGLEGFNYLWLLWEFEIPKRQGWSATVKPPRLGGNTHMGVFATRSPFRPNPIGLSSVKLERIEETPKGPVLYVSGVDLRDHTPIFDIKPYIPYSDLHEDASYGFTKEVKDYSLTVECEEKFLSLFPEEKRQTLLHVLAQDPRPSYQEDPTRQYGVAFAGWDVHFFVREGVLTVTEVVPYQGPVKKS
ncbi:MAG: tRNA (N6-threonylcarbamoyladenosine(37)-N6)-methyltransferase TrmO [Lachnospiraceae bacterium]|nr:tRNA (N6-threonylcarbamoyladenosine(37)-N6)-methyltransferase TrmO [Lachnospiraceae bacterium]